VSFDGIRLSVEIPLDVPAANVAPLRIETMCVEVYRTGPGANPKPGEWFEDRVGVVAYVPKEARRPMSPLLYSACVGRDYIKGYALLKDNKRSLRDFMASNEDRMTLAG
jgi:hypothetical protein